MDMKNLIIQQVEYFFKFSKEKNKMTHLKPKKKKRKK